MSAGRTEREEGAASGRRSEDGGRLDRWPVAGGPRAVSPLAFCVSRPFLVRVLFTAAAAHSTSSCCCTWPPRPVVRRSGFDCCRCSLIVRKLFTFISFLVLVLVHVEKTRIIKETGSLLSVSAPSVRKKLKKSSTFFEEASWRLKSLSVLIWGRDSTVSSIAVNLLD